MKVRRIAALLTTLVALSAIILPMAFAADRLEISMALTEIEGKQLTDTISAGDHITVTARIDNNPGVCSIELKYVYDSEILELTNVAKATGMVGTMTKGNGFFLWDHDEDYIAAADFIVLTFAVKAGTADGTKTDVSLTCEKPNHVSNYDEANVPVSITPCHLTIGTVQPGGEIALNKTDIALTEGEGDSLTVLGTSGQPLEWTSSDPSVVTVDESGKVTARKSGTATVTATMQDGRQATCQVTVDCDGGEYDPGTEPAYDEEGMQPHWFCSNCNKYYFDHNGVRGEETTREALVIAPVPPVITEPQITVSTETAKVGDTVTVSVNMANNPGVAVLTLGISYDRSKLEYVGFEDVGLTDWSVATKAVWVGNTDSSFNGTILKLKFKVKAGIGTTVPVSVTCGRGDAYNYDEEPVAFTTVSGGVTVQLPDEADLTALLRHVAGIEEWPEAANMDMNSDGEIDAADVTLLAQALSANG